MLHKKYIIFFKMSERHLFVTFAGGFLAENVGTSPICDVRWRIFSWYLVKVLVHYVNFVVERTGY
jgi:hypothetical protein